MSDGHTHEANRPSPSTPAESGRGWSDARPGKVILVGGSRKLSGAVKEALNAGVARIGSAR
jgi:hypothetical protein